MTRRTDWGAWNIKTMEIKIMDAYEKKYNDLIARINAVKNTPKIGMKGKHHYDGYVETGIRDALDYILNPESEDERIIERLLEYFRGFYDKFSGKNNVNVHWEGLEVKKVIAYLEKQKEQKPAEWSEEDEEALRELLNILSRRDVEVSDDTEWLSFKLKNWLKSLRPSWKPSEEQIGILGKVFAGCKLKDSERDSMVDLFYHLKDMI